MKNKAYRLLVTFFLFCVVLYSPLSPSEEKKETKEEKNFIEKTTDYFKKVHCNRKIETFLKEPYYRLIESKYSVKDIIKFPFFTYEWPSLLDEKELDQVKITEIQPPSEDMDSQSLSQKGYQFHIKFRKEGKKEKWLGYFNEEIGECVIERSDGFILKYQTFYTSSAYIEFLFLIPNDFEKEATKPREVTGWWFGKHFNAIW